MDCGDPTADLQFSLLQHSLHVTAEDSWGHDMLGDSGERIVHILRQSVHILACLTPLLVLSIFVQYCQGSSNTKHDNALAGLRSLLMLFIFFYHTNVVEVNVVGAFFTLSGAVLTLSTMSSRRDSNQLTEHSLICAPLMILKRWLCVLPCACACALITPSNARFDNILHFWEDCWYSFGDTSQLMRSMLNFFDGRNLGLLWFVQCILFMHMLFPILDRILSRLKLMPATCGIAWWVWVMAGCVGYKMAIIVYAMFHGESNWYVTRNLPGLPLTISLYTWPISWIPDFVVGMVLPLMSSSEPHPAKQTTGLSVLDATLLCSMLVALLMPLRSYTMPFSDLHGCLPLTALLIWSCLPGSGQSSQVLCLRPLVAFSDYTFCFYLCHMSVASWLSATAWPLGAQPFPVFVLLALCGGILLAWALHTVVERPISRFVSWAFKPL